MLDLASATPRAWVDEAWASIDTALLDRVEPARFLDSLLACALIEARSCERMKLLAETRARLHVLAELEAAVLREPSEIRLHSGFAP